MTFQTRADVLSVVEQGIRISDVIRLGISIIALIVGAIAVANTMLMSVFERTPRIWCGASSRSQSQLLISFSAD